MLKMLNRLTFGLLVGFVLLVATVGKVSAEAVVVVFLNDTDYVYMHGDTPADSGGQNGVETGTYTWDSGTGSFTASPVVDTTGDWGFSDPIGAMSVTVASDVAAFADDVDYAEAPRIVSSLANPLVGTWSLWNSFSDQIVATFFDDMTYMLGMFGTAETGTIVGQTGVELGTYLWDESTGAFSAPSIITDTNGMWGFSDPLSPMSISVSGDTLTFADDSETVELSRVLTSTSNVLVGSWGGYSTTAVPEPSTLLLLGSGLAGLGLVRRKFRA